MTNIIIGEKGTREGDLSVLIYMERKAIPQRRFTVDAIANGRSKMYSFDTVFDALDFAGMFLNGAYTVDGDHV